MPPRQRREHDHLDLARRGLRGQALLPVLRVGVAVADDRVEDIVARLVPEGDGEQLLGRRVVAALELPKTPVRYAKISQNYPSNLPIFSQNLVTSFVATVVRAFIWLLLARVTSTCAQTPLAVATGSVWPTLLGVAKSTGMS